MPNERAGPYTGAPTTKPPKPPALAVPSSEPAESLDDGGPLDKIMAKLTTMETNQATKTDIEGLATKAEVSEKIEASKAWATSTFATKEAHDNLEAKTDLRLKMLEQSQAVNVANTLRQMQRNSQCAIYIGNMTEADKEERLKTLVKGGCPTLGMKYSLSFFTRNGTPHCVVTFESASQAKSFREAFKAKENKNAEGQPLIVRNNKQKEQRELERPLRAPRERLVTAYSGAKDKPGDAKPKTAITQHLNVIKVGGKVVIQLDGMGGWMWMKSKEAKEARGVLAAFEGTPLDDEEMEEELAADSSTNGKPK